jgi:Holliday junction resolvase RusA-like endonuclease
VNSVSFTIPGEPQGKARPRVVRAQNGMSLTYTPDKTVRYEELTRLRYREAAQGFRFPDDAQVGIQITAWYSIPKSKSKKVKAAMLAGLLTPTKKPDCDNIVKIICDALNGIAYKDDQQITVAQIRKKYADVPRVDIRLWKV